MSPIEEIFAAFRNSSTQLARAIGGNPKTVSDWKKLRPIPRWWRPTVLEQIRAKGVTLSPEALAYLSPETDAQPDSEAADAA